MTEILALPAHLPGPLHARAGHAPRMTRLATAGLALALLLLAGCGGDADQHGGAGDTGAGDDSPLDSPAGSPLADCAGLTEPPPGAPGPTGSEPLPELALPCFTGGEPFQLADLRGPAVVNLWATWCPPCRDELPELQGYADRAAGEVHVLGVVTGDRPAAAAALAIDLGITFPSLDDRDVQLATQLGASLPATLFVDSAGQVAYLHHGELDEVAIADLVAEHLGAQ